MNKDLVLAIDQGTTGTTCMLVAEDLSVERRCTREFAQHFPRPGWVEHEPAEIWGSVLEALLEVTGGGDRATVERIRAIGVTNQRETCLLWQRTDGAAVHPALVWQDRRTAQVCGALEGDHGERIREVTGLVTDPYFSGTKLAWLLDNVEGARDATQAGKLAAGTIDTYLIWRLTGGKVHATDASNASRTMLWPLEGGGWSEEMAGLLRVPCSLMPEVRPSSGDFGVTSGVPLLPDGIPVRGVMGDQQAALFGQACFARGDLKCTYGTGAFAMLNTGGEPVRSRHGLLTTVGWDLGEGPVYCLEGSAFMAGAVVQWLRDGLGIIDSAPEIESLARTVDDSGGVVLVPAHAGLGAPHWRPEARGLIWGLTRGTGRGHIARAALEGIALQVAELLEAMATDAGGELGTLRVDGGAAANDLLMQIQASLLGTELERPANLETTAMGAVFAAGLAAGVWSSLDEIAQARRVGRCFSPGGSGEELADLRSRWKEAVGRA